MWYNPDVEFYSVQQKNNVVENIDLNQKEMLMMHTILSIIIPIVIALVVLVAVVLV